MVRHPVTKVISVGDAPATDERSLGDARAAFDGRAVVTVSHPMFLEFVAPGVSKGAALRWLARRLRIELRDVLAIGDQLNDLEMVAEVGFGVAMPHGPAELLAVARLVAPPFDEDGAAQVLEAYVLGGRARLTRVGPTGGWATMAGTRRRVPRVGRRRRAATRGRRSESR